MHKVDIRFTWPTMCIAAVCGLTVINDLQNKKYVLWNVYLPNVVASSTPLSKYLTVTVMILNYEGSRSGQRSWSQSKTHQLVVSYLTSIMSDVVSRTVFEIFDIKDIFP